MTSAMTEWLSQLIISPTHRLFFMPTLLDKTQLGDSSKSRGGHSCKCNKRGRYGEGAALMAASYHVMSYAIGLE